MKISLLSYDETRGHLLERPDPESKVNGVKTRFYRGTNLDTFVHWKMEVMSRLGNIDTEIVKPSKSDPFQVLLKRPN